MKSIPQLHSSNLILKRVVRTSRRNSRGFTLLELMIGLLIGLITTLAVTIVMVDSEGIRRRITQGSDAQVNAAMAISALQRNLMHAGYGFMQTPKIINCPIDAR